MTTLRAFGVPMALGARTRGTDMGPSGLRLTGLLGRLRALGLRVEDGGNFVVPIAEICEVGDPTQRYLEPIARLCASLADATEETAAAGATPLVLGGDHSLSAGSVAGVARVRRAAGEALGVIWVDAHGDMNTPETSPSGNVHGMPLAALLGQGPPLLTEIAGGGPAVRPEHTVLLATRSLDPGERARIRDLGVRAFTMPEIDRRGMGEVAEEAAAIAGGAAGGFYVSLDMDALDPSLAPGVGTPVPGGLTYREAHLFMEVVAASGRMRGLDVAEVDPSRDDRNATAELAAELVLSAFGKRIL